MGRLYLVWLPSFYGAASRAPPAPSARRPSSRPSIGRDPMAQPPALPTLGAMNTSTTPRRVPSYQSWLYWSGIGSPGTNPLHVQILWTTAFAAIIALIFVVL